MATVMPQPGEHGAVVDCLGFGGGMSRSARGEGGDRGRAAGEDEARQLELRSGHAVEGDGVAIAKVDRQVSTVLLEHFCCCQL